MASKSHVGAGSRRPIKSLKQRIEASSCGSNDIEATKDHAAGEAGMSTKEREGYTRVGGSGGVGGEAGEGCQRTLSVFGGSFGEY